MKQEKLSNGLTRFTSALLGVMFYGGMILFGVVAVVMIVTNVLLSVKGRKLNQMLHDRYGA